MKRTTPAPPAHGRKEFSQRWIVVGLVFFSLLSAVIWFNHHKFQPYLKRSLGMRGEQAVVPSVDLSRIDPQVATHLRQRIEETRRNPKSASTWGWLGGLFWAYDFRAESRVCLTQAERLEPDNPHWPYFHALSLNIATPNQAIPLLQRTVQLCGNSPEAPRFRLARLLAEQGRWEEARREFDALLAERPDFAPARLLAARAAQARGDVEAAIQLARQCVEDPRTARSSWVLLGTLHRQKNDLSAATLALQRSANVPEDEGFSDPFAAEIAVLRNDPRELCERAHPLLASRHLTQAAALVERLRLQHQNYPETWLLVGRLCLLSNDLAGAEMSLRKHLELDPKSIHGLFQLGSALLRQERFTHAAAAFEKATQLKPDFGPGWYNLGVARGRSGQTREAVSAFRESLRHNPERLDTYFLLADLHLRLGERDQAVALLDQAEKIKADDARLSALRARANGRR